MRRSQHQAGNVPQVSGKQAEEVLKQVWVYLAKILQIDHAQVVVGLCNHHVEQSSELLLVGIDLAEQRHESLDSVKVSRHWLFLADMGLPHSSR